MDKRLTSEQVAQVLRLRSDGLTYRQIAAETGFSQGAIGRALKAGPARLNPSDKAARRKADVTVRVPVVSGMMFRLVPVLFVCDS